MSAAALPGADELAELGFLSDHERLERELGAFAYRRMLEQALTRIVPVSKPATGSEWSITVPDGFSWELVSVKYRLITSATVVTRTPRLAFLDQDGNRYMTIAPAGSQAASVSADHCYVVGIGIQLNLASTISSLPPPPVAIRPGTILGSLTGSLDAGDIFDLIFLQVRDWSPGRVRNAIRTLLADLDSVGGFH